MIYFINPQVTIIPILQGREIEAHWSWVPFRKLVLPLYPSHRTQAPSPSLTQLPIRSTRPCSPCCPWATSWPAHILSIPLSIWLTTLSCDTVTPLRMPCIRPPQKAQHLAQNMAPESLCREEADNFGKTREGEEHLWITSAPPGSVCWQPSRC